MATVYLALQESLQRHVALKVIASNLKGDPDFTKRFLREGRLIAKLTDPRIITVFDIGIDEDVYYLAMEYLPGGTLRDRIQAGLSLEDTLQIVKTVAGALGYAHRRGIVHRDIKPQNIMFHENGDPVLSDFGIAKAIGGNTVMTMSGMYFGTPRYMSPEQIKGQAVDGRSDLYSLGVLFYEMLTGELPYRSDDSFALAFKHVTEPIPSLPSDLTIFQPLLNRLLAKDLEDRFPSAEQFLKELRDLELQHLLTPTVTETTILPTPPTFAQPSTSPKSQRNYWAVGSFLGLLSLLIVASLYYFLTPGWIARLETNITPQDTVSEKQPNPVQEEQPEASFFLQQARQFFDNGALDESLKTLAQGINAYPEDSDLLALRDRVRDRLEQQLNENNARNQEAERLLERAQRYRQRGNLEAALMDIEEGLKVVAQHPGLLDLRMQVLQQQQEDERQQAHQDRQQKADRFLSQAQRSKENNDLSASEKYIAEGLRLAPKHAGLLALQAEIEQENIADTEQRLEQVQRLLQQARELQQQKQFQASLDKVEQGLTIAPDNEALSALQDQVKTQLETRSRITNLLENCSEHFRANRLTTGDGGNALDCYNSVLDLDPGNTIALAGLENMAERYANWAEQSLQNGAPHETRAYLARLIQVNPEFPRLEQLQRRLAAIQTENSQGYSGLPSLNNPRDGIAAPQTPIIGETQAATFWNNIKDSQDIADFDQFLVLFGDHPRYGLAARLKRERLRREQGQTTPSERVFLTIKADKPDAHVWIDGKDYGPTGQEIALPPGAYNISVEKEGYEEWREQIQLATGNDKTVMANLNLLPPAESQASAQISSEQDTSSNQGVTSEGQTNEGSVANFGCIEGDCTNGFGTYLFKNGDKFTGQWKNSQIFNQGIYQYHNGEKYEGQFVDGKINGTGTYYYNSGNRYEGTWKDGIKSGTGTHYYAARGERYVGEFKDNEPHGEGIYYYKNGDRYQGQWQNGRKHGKGKYYQHNGESYTGIWENNRKVKVISFEQNNRPVYE
jgi:serine/threonine-protein kinase PpkA